MHMNFEDAINSSLALILWAKTNEGEDDVIVYSGTLVKKNKNYYLKREDDTEPEIRNEWLPRIEPVPEDLKETLLGCEYQLSLTVGNSKDATEALESFGLKWPKS